MSNWDYWNGDAAFGPCLFLNLIPAVLGLTALLDRLCARLPRVALRAAGCLIIWTLLLMSQCALQFIPSNAGVPSREDPLRPNFGGV